ncbi:Rieske 2Fe-2S domain-containing protein [Nostoc sp. NIES-2111]
MTYTLFPSLAAAEARVAVDRLFTVRLPSPPFRICLVRRTDGSWRAFEDMCPHKKAPFSKGGYLNAEGEVVCPLHNYLFELDTGQETSGQSCPHLPLFPVLIDDKGLHVKVY